LLYRTALICTTAKARVCGGVGEGGGHALWFEPTHISQCEVAPTCFVDECRWAVKSLLHHLTGLCQREGGWLAVWLDSLPPPPLLGRALESNGWTPCGLLCKTSTINNIKQIMSVGVAVPGCCCSRLGVSLKETLLLGLGQHQQLPAVLPYAGPTLTIDLNVFHTIDRFISNSSTVSSEHSCHYLTFDVSGIQHLCRSLHF
jgi:hypothetical protein